MCFWGGRLCFLCFFKVSLGIGDAENRLFGIYQRKSKEKGCRVMRTKCINLLLSKRWGWLHSERLIDIKPHIVRFALTDVVQCPWSVTKNNFSQQGIIKCVIVAWFLFLVWLNKIKTRIYNGQFETLFHIETNVVTWMCRPFHVLFLQISIIVFWKSRQSRHVCILFEVFLLNVLSGKWRKDKKFCHSDTYVYTCIVVPGTVV